MTVWGHHCRATKAERLPDRDEVRVYWDCGYSTTEPGSWWPSERLRAVNDGDMES